MPLCSRRPRSTQGSPADPSDINRDDVCLLGGPCRGSKILRVALLDTVSRLGAGSLMSTLQRPSPWPIFTSACCDVSIAAFSARKRVDFIQIGRCERGTPGVALRAAATRSIRAGLTDRSDGGIDEQECKSARIDHDARHRGHEAGHAGVSCRAAGGGHSPAAPHPLLDDVPSFPLDDVRSTCGPLRSASAMEPPPARFTR
jgi:hypothetical protein